MNNVVVLITGGFDPIHSGHIAYINAAKQLGNILVVGANSDNWLTRKKGSYFMPWAERSLILSAMSGIDRVINFNDDDETAKDAIRKVREIYTDHHIIFANGGDRTSNNIPEMDIKDENLSFAFGVGGEDKKNSSSWILQEWKAPKTIRSWGWYRVLDVKDGYKVKELVIEPGQSLSDQRHFKRAEHWYVLKGMIKLDTEWQGVKDSRHIKEYQNGYIISKEVWHQASNPTKELAHILEVQYGEECVEEDIERR